jgi:MYXO-CTERM domain-containing protein
MRRNASIRASTRPQFRYRSNPTPAAIDGIAIISKITPIRNVTGTIRAKNSGGGTSSCVGPFTVELQIDPESCGDGMVQEWETCDEDSPLCVMCENTCGNGMCDMPAENSSNCPEDCGPCDGVCGTADDPMCPDDCPDTDSDSGAVCGDGTCDDGEVCPEDCGDTSGECNGVCEPTGGETCPEDCGVCGDNICQDGEDCPEDCGDTATDTIGECPDGGAPGADGQCQLDDDGCGCVADGQGTRGLWGSLLLLGVFGVRRSRKRA